MSERPEPRYPEVISAADIRYLLETLGPGDHLASEMYDLYVMQTVQDDRFPGHHTRFFSFLARKLDMRKRSTLQVTEEAIVRATDL